MTIRPRTMVVRAGHRMNTIKRSFGSTSAPLLIPARKTCVLFPLLGILSTKTKSIYEECKLKGTVSITFHLGCYFFRDNQPALCNKSVITSGERRPSEIDTSELLDEKGIQQYQWLIGALQEWDVSIGRIDITTAVVTLSGFRCAPRQGHLDLAKMKHATIRVRTDEADYSSLPEQDFDRTYSVYGNIQDAELADASGALGKDVALATGTYCVDVNLFQDVINDGRSVSGILHLANKTSIDCYSKKQTTVETATYGSEYVAARSCIEQQTPIEATVETATYSLEYFAACTCVDPIMDLRLTLKYIRSKRYVFGDNKTVVESSIRPHDKLHKRHMTLSFHRVREAIAAKTVGF
jgi:hypothetical protein